MCYQTDGYSSAEPSIEAVIFDLDDTLYAQADWLAGAWDAVARRAAEFGVDEHHFRAALIHVAAQGTDRGRLIDRALDDVGAHGVPVDLLVDTFRHFHVHRLWPYPGAAETLRLLATRVPIGLVTDGDPGVQRDKLRALRLAHMFDAVVFTDELGRERRKPHPAGLVSAARALRVDPSRCVYVGDRPEKDVVAARAARMRAVRVRTGEYAARPDTPRAWFVARDLPHTARQLLPRLARSSGSRSGPHAA